MSQPYFSIIIPVYKLKKDYFDECMKSVISQTFRDIEIILVDDGSPDCSGKWCDEYASKDFRVGVIHKDHEGVSVARNVGVQKAIGKWLLFVDADDWLEVNACEILKMHIEKSASDILVFHAYKHKAKGMNTVDNHGMEYDKVYCSESLDELKLLYRKAMQPANILKTSVSTCTTYYVWDKVFNGDFLKKNNILFPVGISNSEDKVFFLNCLKKIKTIQYINECLYHYRIISTSATRGYSENIDKDRRKLCILLKDMAKDIDLELGIMSDNSNDHTVESDATLFTYMICSSILLNKYYHKEYPYRLIERKKNAKKILDSEPFCSAIREINYRDIKMKEKVRKWLLANKRYFLFRIACRVSSR